MRRYLPVLCVGTLLLLSAVFGCGDITQPDTDDEMLKAKGLLSASQVTDSIDPEGGDKRDWREFSYFEKAQVTVIYHVGDPFKGHDIRGSVQVFDPSGNKLGEKSVVPGQRDYEVQFVAEANTKYFVVFDAVEGKSHYLIDVKAESLDPCAKCTEDEKCDDGHCVPKVIPCDPSCDKDEECTDGRCVKIECDEGEYFSISEEECLPDPCAKKRCGRRQHCERRSGKAVCVGGGTPAPRKTCEPACKDGEVCAGTKCVPKSEAPKPDKPLTGKILNFWPEGSSTIMLLNRGSENGVKKGMTGMVTGGGAFTVIEVYPFQCRASTKMSREQLTGKRAVSFKR